MPPLISLDSYERSFSADEQEPLKPITFDGSPKQFLDAPNQESIGAEMINDKVSHVEGSTLSSADTRKNSKSTDSTLEKTLEPTILRDSDVKNDRIGQSTRSSPNGSEVLSASASMVHGPDFTSGSVIHMPSAILESLLSTMNGMRNDMASLRCDVSELSGLRKDISDLRTENKGLFTQIKTLGTEIKGLTMLAGGSFLLFPKLPIDIRLMIWKIAIDEPNVVSVRNSCEDSILHQISLPPVLLRVNAEARNEVLKVRQPFQFSDGDVISYSRVFLNPDQDTLWLDATNMCDANELGYHLLALIECGLSMVSPRNEDVPFKILRLAIDYDIWYKNLTTEISTHRMMIKLQSVGVEELILVTSPLSKESHGLCACSDENSSWDSEPLRRASVEFIEPSRDPKYVLDEQLMHDYTFPVPTGSSPGVWKDVEMEANWVIPTYIAECIAERKNLLDSGVTLDQLDTDDEYAHLLNISGWTPPRVIFREAKALQHS